ncbi:MAG: hypothetical protein R3C20_11680 [Planctomycetaceae bacterium]
MLIRVRTAGLWIGFTLLFVLIWPSTGMAQLQGTLAEEPLGLWYMRGMTGADTLNYSRRLSERLQIGEELMKQIPEERLEGLFTTAPEPVTGGAYYMVRGLLPSFETISFQQVVDEVEARRMLDARKSQFGGSSNQVAIEVRGDNCYVLKNSWSSRSQLPEGADEQQYLQPVQNSGSRFQVNRKIVEEDGKKYLEHSSTITQCFRYHDGLLYESGFEELFDMSLPATDSLTRAVDGQNDLGIQVFFDRIPIGIRQLGWTMINSGLGTELQQRDDEKEEEYKLRKSAGDTFLPLIRAILFDIDKTEGWIRFADESSGSIRARLEFAARRNSGITKSLQEMGAGNSRFAPVLNDGAALTLHSCIRLPEESKNFFESAAQFLTIKSIDAPNAEITSAMQVIATSLNDMAEDHTLEFLIKAGWSPASDGVIYGGVQIGEDASLIKALHQMMTRLPGIPDEALNGISLLENDGLQVLEMRIREADAAQIEQFTSMKMSHLFVAQSNGCLWFSLGNENALQMIHQSRAKTDSAGYAMRAPLFSFELDGQRWLDYPQDEPVGVGGLLGWLDENAAWFPPGPMSVVTEDKPTKLIEAVRALGGDEVFQLKIDADESGLVLDGRMGESIGNYYIARMISVRDAMQRRAIQRENEAAARNRARN